MLIFSFLLSFNLDIYQSMNYPQEQTYGIGEKEAHTEFIVFDASKYSHKPSEFRQLTHPAYILSAWALFELPPVSDYHPNELPSEKRVRGLLRLLPKKAHVIIDLEWYSIRPENTDQEINSGIKKLLTILNWIKEERTDVKVGYYGIIPRNDWQIAYPAHGPGSAYYQSWADHNNKLESLAAAADFLAPSIYTYHTRNVQNPPFPNLWENYIRLTIKESRRLSGGKPVYPFMWPQYHESNKEGLAGTYLSGDDWKYQLEIVRETADGLVLWGGTSEFNHGQWWLEMKRFLYMLRSEKLRRY